MVIGYFRADEDQRTRLDGWLTDALKAAFKEYVYWRYGVNLRSLSIEQEKEYWREFGLRAQAFLARAEPYFH